MTETGTGVLLHDVLWTEKYRPERLEDLALAEDTRRVLSAYLEVGEIPNVLLVGPPGVGKTTVARILIRALDCRALVLNASAERGIDTVRQKIGTFVSISSNVRWNIPFLDEADALTADAQTALRNMIESHADYARFILTANRLSRIIGPIQSRCQVLHFAAPPFPERYRIFASVLQQEGIEAEPQVIISWAEHHTDLRQLLMRAQQAYLAKGHLPGATPSGGATGGQLAALLLERNWTGLRRIAASEGFDPADALRELFWSVPEEHPKAGFLRHVLGRGVHETGFTPDPIILFLGVCSEAMEGLS